MWIVGREEAAQIGYPLSLPLICHQFAKVLVPIITQNFRSDSLVYYTLKTVRF